MIFADIDEWILMDPTDEHHDSEMLFQRAMFGGQIFTWQAGTIIG